MTRAQLAGAGCAVILLLALLAAGGGYWLVHRVPAPTPVTEIAPPTAPEGADAHPPPESGQGFLYGRITSVDGAVFEGRLRWGAGEQEAFWGDSFNGTTTENPWLSFVPADQRDRRSTEDDGPVEIFGIRLGREKEEAGPGRPFLAPFGQIARVEADGRDVRVTLKSGTVLELDRLEASDFDDEMRVWDARGVFDLKSLWIAKIDFLPTPELHDVPYRLYGTVRTRRGQFTGFIAWDRDDGVGSDTLDARTADGEVALRFDTIRSIARGERDRAVVTLLDGEEIELSGGSEVGRRNRGIAIDDPRFGRVEVSWDVFERVDFADFTEGGSGPAYDDFAPGRPLEGAVTTRDGRRLAGRLVYDIDENESTDTLDADAAGVHYTIPFGTIAAIAPHPKDPKGPTVTLRGGESLRLERTGDLRDENTGMLVFAGGGGDPEYVAWADVERIEFDPETPGPSS